MKTLKELIEEKNLSIYWDTFDRVYILVNQKDGWFFREDKDSENWEWNILQHPLFIDELPESEISKLHTILIKFYNNLSQISSNIISVNLDGSEQKFQFGNLMRDAYPFKNYTEIMQGEIEKQKRDSLKKQIHDHKEFFSNISWNLQKFREYKKINPNGKTLLPLKRRRDGIDVAFYSSCTSINHESYESLCCLYLSSERFKIETEEELALVPHTLPNRFCHYETRYSHAANTYPHIIYDDLITSLCEET